MSRSTILAMSRPASVHPTAIVDPSAKVHPACTIGPYCRIGPKVELGEACQLISHVVMEGPSRIGAHNQFFPFCSVGLAPQDISYAGEPTRLEIGDHNVIREFATINRGTVKGGGLTRVGSHTLIMAYAHVAHDCIIGDHVILANAATLGGHVIVEEWATVGALCPVHHFVRIGSHSFIGGGTTVTRDVLPFSKTAAARETHAYGLNAVGLERRGFSKERIRKIHHAYKILLASKLNTSQALEKLKSEPERSEGVHRAVMAGQVKHKQIFSSIRPDWRLAKLLLTLGTRNTDSLLGAIGKVLADEGIILENSTSMLEPLLAKAGVLTKRAPTEPEQKNIDYGRAVARHLAQFDIGQTVVVAESACVAVEAMEGTDATIERASQIIASLDSNPSILSRALTVVTIAKPNPEMRFQVPVVGAETIEVMRNARAPSLAIVAVT